MLCPNIIEPRAERLFFHTITTFAEKQFGKGIAQRIADAERKEMMTRRQLRDMGITDEEIITQILNARTGEMEDMKEAHAKALEQVRQQAQPGQAAGQAQQAHTPAQQAAGQAQAPAEQAPGTTQTSASDEAEQLRRELAAERAMRVERETQDAIMSQLSAFKPKNAEHLYKMIDTSKIVIENGVVKSGLKEQVEPLKQSSGYMFTDTADERGGADQSAAPTTVTMNDIIRGNG